MILENSIGVHFCPKNYKQPTPSNVFLNGVWVQFCDHVKYFGVWLNTSLKDDDDIQTSEITRLCSKEASRHFRSVFSCSTKNFISCLFHASICLPMVEQIHTD